MSADEVVLPSGRVAYANMGIVGINSDGEVADGYDGDLDGCTSQWQHHPRRWTNAERVELADLMIERWKRFREKAATGG